MSQIAVRDLVLALDQIPNITEFLNGLDYPNANKLAKALNLRRKILNNIEHKHPYFKFHVKTNQWKEVEFI